MQNMYVQRKKKRVYQGDILKNFEFNITKYQQGKITIDKIYLPWTIILTQDCDLERDFENRNNSLNNNNDKFLHSILICPAYIAEKFKEGNHLEKLRYKMATWGGSLWKYIKSNQNERFHYLDINLKKQIPNLVIDFKHYYTIRRDYIYQEYKDKYKTSLDILFREKLSQRFSNYLSRIGLPVKNN